MAWRWVLLLGAMVPTCHLPGSRSAMATALTVRTSARRSLPGVLPSQAQASWREFTFGEGGGLLGVVALNRGSGRRLLLPALMEEVIDEELETPGRVCYRVSKRGLLLDVVEGSHRAEVTFDPDGSAGTEMTWQVEFEVDARAWLWQPVTDYLIGTAASNLAAYTAPEDVFRLTAPLPSFERPGDAVRSWVEYIWDGGGGLPIPPPLVLEPPLMQPGDRLVLPPGLLERLVSVSEDEGRIDYMVVNPGLFTYQVYTHRGAVEFAPRAEGGVAMEWTVRIRPLPGLGPVVRSFTELAVGALSRNFQLAVGGGEGGRIEAGWSKGDR